MSAARTAHRVRSRLTCIALLTMGFALFPAAAEYGDVVIAKQTPSSDQRAVVFPHWFHRIRYRCNVCHVELGIQMRAGANLISMKQITDGKYCGACHNGRIAWGPDRCELCHSAKPGVAAGIQGGSQTKGPGIW